MEEIVIWLAANPYAVVLGLLVSALPVFVSVLKTLYRSATFVVGAARTGLSAQIKRTGRMHARRAYKVKKLDRQLRLARFGLCT